jgi:hypothetical protein
MYYSKTIIMPIKVNTPTIKCEDFVKILEFYNEHKPTDAEPLERLNRAEGGFQINAKKAVPHPEPNNNIRQLRWFYQRLVGYDTYNTLTKEEEGLLYKSLKSVLGENMVVWE